PRAYVLGGRLSLGAYAFYVIGESSAGLAPELGFGANVGPVRIGGAAALLFGRTLAVTLDARVTSTSPKKVAFLGAADLGVFYGGTNAVFAPYLTLHVGLRIRTGLVALELRIASLSAFWVNNGVRFVPQTGLGVLL